MPERCGAIFRLLRTRSVASDSGVFQHKWRADARFRGKVLHGSVDTCSDRGVRGRVVLATLAPMGENKLSTLAGPADSLGVSGVSRDRWYVLGVLTFVYMINIADRIAISTLIEPIKAEFALTDTAVGFLTGVALAIFYVGAGIPLASLADRYSRRNMVVAALFSWSVMTVVCGMAQNFWQLLAARIGVGVGEAGGTPPSASILADKFPAKDRAMALTIFVLGVPAGYWIGTSVTGRIADTFGWRAPLLALGIPGILAAILVWAIVKEPKRGQLDAMTIDRRPASLPQTLKFMRARNSIFHLLMATTLHAFWGGGMLWWAPAFLMRSHSMSIGEAGGALGPMHLIGGTACILFTSWLMTRRAAVDPRNIASLLALSTVAGTIASVLGFAVGDQSFAIAAMWVFVTLSQLYFGPTIGLMQNLVPPGMRAQSLAIFLFTLNVANLIVAPQLIGIASDLLAGTYGDESLRWALVMVTPVGMWSAYHFWAAKKNLREDCAFVGLEVPR